MKRFSFTEITNITRNKYSSKQLVALKEILVAVIPTILFRLIERISKYS